MAEAARQGDKLNVFISYSRDDLAFADQLDASLQLAGFETTIDRRGISGGEDWKTRLGALIRDADTVVFVLSPSSARSEICAWEVEEAVRLGKRIIPVLCRAARGREARHNSSPTAIISTSTQSRNRRARDSGRGCCGSRRRSTPISTGCASTRGTCDWRKSGTRSASPRLAGFYPAPTSRWPRHGRRAGPRMRRSRPHCSSISSRRARQRTNASKAPRRRGCGSWRRRWPRGRRRMTSSGPRNSETGLVAGVARARDLRAAGEQCGRSADGDAVGAGGVAGPGVWRRASGSSEAAAALHQAWLRNRETTLAGHRGSVISASFSADGTHVVTASADKTARVWDLRGERPSFVALEGHQGPVISASFSADGTHVVTASDDKTARVWDLRGKRPSFAAARRGISGPVNSASFSADGTHVVTASDDKTARVWDLRGSGRALSPSRGIGVRSTPRRSAPTERMWSRRPMTRQRGCGTCAASGRPSSR